MSYAAQKITVVCPDLLPTSTRQIHILCRPPRPAHVQRSPAAGAQPGSDLNALAEGPSPPNEPPSPPPALG
jgi:hypothetical protein